MCEWIGKDQLQKIIKSLMIDLAVGTQSWSLPEAPWGFSPAEQWCCPQNYSCSCSSLQLRPWPGAPSHLPLVVWMTAASEPSPVCASYWEETGGQQNKADHPTVMCTERKSGQVKCCLSVQFRLKYSRERNDFAVTKGFS